MKSRPSLPIDKVLGHITSHGVKDKVCILGIRGFWAKNKRMIYDDAIFLVAPGFFASFTANCDPGAFRKGIANLKPGVWKYKIGIHGLSKPIERRYKALVQADKVTVIRDQVGPDTGWFGINIHRGGENSVSSLGCQTIHPSQWNTFIQCVEQKLKDNGQKIVPYVLIETTLK
jgi:hypothetical protein